MNTLKCSTSVCLEFDSSPKFHLGLVEALAEEPVGLPAHQQQEKTSKGSVLSHKKQQKIDMCMYVYTHISLSLFLFIGIYLSETNIFISSYVTVIFQPAVPTITAVPPFLQDSVRTVT